MSPLLVTVPPTAVTAGVTGHTCPEMKLKKYRSTIPYEFFLTMSIEYNSTVLFIS